MDRNWVEKLFIKVIKEVKPEIDLEKLKDEELQDLLSSYLPSLLDTFHKYVKKESLKVLKGQKKDMNNFKKSLKSRWGEAFDLLEIFIAYNLDFGVTISEAFRKENSSVKFEVLLRLHARACQLSCEILELLKGGFADGALARWRTLYEISVIATFLEDKTEDLSQKYLDYSNVESYYEMLEYQENCSSLGYEPYSKNEMQVAMDQFKDLQKRYGNGFTKQYGWASDYLDKGKRTFKGVEETVEFKFMRSFYKMANNYIHGGSKGFLFKLGMSTQDTIMLAGPSNYGLADPGQNCALSLFHTTLTLTQFDPHLEDILRIKTSEILIDELSYKFVEIQKEIEKEEQES